MLASLKAEGMPVFVGRERCLASASTPAVYVMFLCPERWWNSADEYELPGVVFYDKTGNSADDEIHLLVLVAVRTATTWRIVREERRAIPASWFSLGRRTRG
jgi:hypothetical protein